jgi:type IV secretory pathway VirB4 component
MGLKDLAAKKTTKPAATKAKGIVLDIPDNLTDEVEGWVENQRNMKDAKANMEQHEQEILQYAEPAWRKACEHNGSVETSVKLGSVRISWKSKSQFVTSTSLGDGERAKAVFGDEFGKYFKEIDGPMELTEDAVKNEAVAARLEEVLGQLQDEFPDVPLVTYKTKLVATDALYQDWVMHSHDEIENKFAAAGIKRTKPTFAAR